MNIESFRESVEQVGLAIAVSQGRETDERLAVLEDRDRIGRDLHDLVIQRLFAVGLGLESTARRSADPATAERLATAVDDLDATIKPSLVSRRSFAAPRPTGSSALNVGSNRLRTGRRSAGRRRSR